MKGGLIVDRFRNYGLWVAIGSFLLLVLQSFGLDIDVGQYDKLLDAFLSILVLAGIINNPSNGKGFFDNNSKKK